MSRLKLGYLLAVLCVSVIVGFWLFDAMPNVIAALWSLGIIALAWFVVVKGWHHSLSSKSEDKVK